MRLVLESDDGEELRDFEADEEHFVRLERDLRSVVEENPDYPEAWGAKNLAALHGAMEVLRAAPEQAGKRTRTLDGEP